VHLRGKGGQGKACQLAVVGEASSKVEMGKKAKVNVCEEMKGNESRSWLMKELWKVVA